MQSIISSCGGNVNGLILGHKSKRFYNDMQTETWDNDDFIAIATTWKHFVVNQSWQRLLFESAQSAFSNIYEDFCCRIKTAIVRYAWGMMEKGNDDKGYWCSARLGTSLHFKMKNALQKGRCWVSFLLIMIKKVAQRICLLLTFLINTSTELQQCLLAFPPLKFHRNLFACVIYRLK